MRVPYNDSKVLILLAALAIPASGVSAQQANSPGDAVVTVTGTLPTDLSTLTKGPELDGFISARHGDQLQVTSPDGTNTVVTVGQATQVRGSGGFLGLNRDKLSTDALINGLPVAVQTVRWGQGLGASRVQLKSKDLQTASMIRNGTEQRFGEHGAAIQQNAAATEALRGRLGDIDQYNIKHTTNVNFAVDKATLSPQAKNDLCATAAEAEGIDNALLLVVGYTDSTGDQAYNQQLSEKRAGGVVNYLQQACHWKPYRMLTPTGMSEADPLASNDTAEGKAQNRRVAVNIMVSKSVDGL